MHHTTSEMRLIAEAAEERYKRTGRKADSFPKLRASVDALVPALLRSAVFGVSRTRGELLDRALFPVLRFDDETVVYGSVVYTGRRLGQFHKRVLLGLLQLAQGTDGRNVAFNAAAFLTGIGRDSSTASVEALRAALEDLRGATFTVRQYEGDRGAVFGFISSAAWAGRDFEVELDRRAMAAFYDCGKTYLPAAPRRALQDGLATWLLDLFFASKQAHFSVQALADAAGRMDAREFGREVRQALEKLKAAGALKSYELRRGGFSIEKTEVR